MKMAELCKTLQVAKAQIIYVIHDEHLEFEDDLDLTRFADKLRKEGFIPLIARDFRPHGEAQVSAAIAASQFTIILAFSEETMKQAERLGVPFVEISDFKRLIE